MADKQNVFTRETIIDVPTVARQQGFTMIELIVVVSIVGILATIVVTQFAGVNKKYLHESDIKALYSDIMEMRLKSFSENSIYGVFWDNPSSEDDYAFKEYELRGAANDEDIEDSDDTVLQTVEIDPDDKGFAHIIVYNDLRSVHFTAKGMADIDEELYFYVECKECDKHTDGCDASDPADTACFPADTPAAEGKCDDTQAFDYCYNPNYPEFSCVSVNRTTIKMGKWCDKNCDKNFDPGECQNR